MDLFTIFLTALALSADAFTVAAALASSIPDFSGRQRFRLSLHFGVFQALMPVLGWAGGEALAGRFGDIARYLAAAALFITGARMLLHRESDGTGSKLDPTRGLSLVSLSFATSFDALAVGISLGLLKVPIALPALLIGLVCAAITLLGTFTGSAAGKKIGRMAPLLAGLVLIALAIKIAFF